MIGLDTNVLVRFLIQDDPEQGRAATALIETCREDDPGFIAREVIVELVWVLERGYKLSKDTIAAALDGLLGAAELIVEDSDRVARAVSAYKEDGFGFADVLIISAALGAGCTTTYTFDRKAAQMAGATAVP